MQKSFREASPLLGVYADGDDLREDMQHRDGDNHCKHWIALGIRGPRLENPFFAESRRNLLVDEVKEGVN